MLAEWSNIVVTDEQPERLVVVSLSPVETAMDCAFRFTIGGVICVSCFRVVVT